jgi:hypothetical protein
MILLMAAEQGPDVLICMPNRTNRIVMRSGFESREAPQLAPHGRQKSADPVGTIQEGAKLGGGAEKGTAPSSRIAVRLGMVVYLPGALELHSRVERPSQPLRQGFRV